MITAVSGNDEGRTVFIVGLNMADIERAAGHHILIPLADVLAHGKDDGTFGDRKIKDLAIVILTGPSDQDTGLRAAHLMGADDADQQVLDLVAIAHEHDRPTGLHVEDGATRRIL